MTAQLFRVANDTHVPVANNSQHGTQEAAVVFLLWPSMSRPPHSFDTVVKPRPHKSSLLYSIPTHLAYNSIDSYNSSTAQSLLQSMAESLEQEADGLYLDDDDDDTSLDHKTTARQSFIHLLKGYVGPGCLSLPWAFSQLGVVGGTLACFTMAYWSSYNCWTVVELKRHMPSSATTYPAVAGWLYGRRMHHFTSLCIVVQQLAICTVFLSFIGTNLEAVLKSTLGWSMGHVGVLTLALPAVMALSFLPNLKALAPVTAAGTAFLLLGLALLAVVIVVEWPHRPVSDDTPLDWQQVPLAFCAILYSYEGICLILPVESSMQYPRQFFGVFSAAMASSAGIFATVAVASVLAFGHVTDGSITAFLLEKYADNAGIQGWLLAANAAVSLSVLVTYPLQLFPCLELLGPLFADDTAADFTTLPEEEDEDVEMRNGLTAPTDASLSSSSSSPHVSPAPTIVSTTSAPVTYDSPRMRVILVLTTYVIAAVVPNVQALISLAGALAGSSTALLIPPVLELAYWRQNNVGGWKVSRCFLLIAGGLLFLGIGTFASLADIARAYGRPAR